MSVPGRNERDLLTVASSGQGRALVASYESVIKSAAHNAHAPARGLIQQFESHLRALRGELHAASRAAQTGLVRQVESSVEALRTRVRHLDALSSALRAPPLPTPTLASQVAELASRFEVRTSLPCKVDVHRVSGASLSAAAAEQSSAALEFVREALDNVARHANGRSARVGLTYAKTGLTVSVVDNGWGACPAAIAAKPGGGIARSRRAIEALSGTLKIGHGASGGTLLTASLPSTGAGAVAAP